MAGPASWSADSHALREYWQNQYRVEILNRIEHVLPRLVTDPSIFPDLEEAKKLFSLLEMNKVVRAIESAQEEKRRNEQIAKLWQRASDEVC